MRSRGSCYASQHGLGPAGGAPVRGRTGGERREMELTDGARPLATHRERREAARAGAERADHNNSAVFLFLLDLKVIYV